MTTVEIKLNFGPGTDQNRADVKTNGVPSTLILDSLKILMSHFAKEIVAESDEMVPESQREAYIEARMKVDRQKEKDL